MQNDNELTQRLEALEKEVQLLKDKEEIRDVLSRYGHYYDLGYFDDWYGLWADDSKFIEPNGSRNKQQLKEFFGEKKSAYLAEQHVQVAVVIKVEGDTAKAIGFQIATKHSIGQFFEKVVLDPRLTIGFERIGIRSWVFQKVNGKWLIKEAQTRNMVDEAGCKELLPPGW